MTIPYRTQRVIQRIVTAILVLLTVALAGVACYIIWAQRYIVYTENGARLDFSLGPIASGPVATEPEKMEITIDFDDGQTTVDTDFTLKKLNGYYVEPETLSDLEAVKNDIKSLEPGTAVMIDVKSAQGAFYYSSKVGSARAGSVNTEQMDELIDYLARSDVYAIARIPALRDYTYGLNHVPDGVHHISGGYLYQDDGGCYWLHPASEGTLSFLTQIIMELRDLGFDEVVLDEFCFPETTKIMVNGDKAQILTKAASTLYAACATDRFAVSFVRKAEFTMPEGRTRLYITGLDAMQAADAAANSGVADTEVGLVFLTELHDTRFDVYSVMRPLTGAH